MGADTSCAGAGPLARCPPTDVSRYILCRNLVLNESPPLEVGGHVGTSDVHLPQVLDRHDWQPPHQRLGRSAGDAELGLERLRVEELGRRSLTAHLP